MLRLKEARNARNITQQQMADFLCIERNSYTRYENGYRSPSMDMLLKIADYLDVSLDYLFGRTDDPRLYLDTEKNLSSNDREQVTKIAKDAIASGTDKYEIISPGSISPELEAYFRTLARQEIDRHNTPGSD